MKNIFMYKTFSKRIITFAEVVKSWVTKKKKLNN